MLAGWNTDGGNYGGFFRNQAPTPERFIELYRKRYGDKADTFLKLYPASTEAEAKQSAGDIAGDKFIACGTWKWIEQNTKTPGVPVYRYHFEQNLPLPEPAAPHAGEIEYVFMTLVSKKLPWTPEHGQVSELMADYWTNFARQAIPTVQACRRGKSAALRTVTK